jgi:membrane dipeptidase
MKRRSFLQSALAVPLANHAGLQAFSGSQGREAPAVPIAIRRAREAALEVLKPSRRELEHGFELHSSSLVVESYGFSPRAGLDMDAYLRAVESGASDLELSDLRGEMMMTRCITSPAEQVEYRAAWRASGVTCVLQNAGEENQSPLRVLRRLARFTYVTDMMRDFVTKAATPDDIEAAKKQGRHCLYLTSNAVPLQERWAGLGSELEQIRVFFQLGIRMMHLTYNRRNMIGDGCAEVSNAGLSDFGRAVVAEMNRVGVIVDVAHSGWQTGLEAAAASSRPIVASHTACAALHHHIRCKPDKLLKAIADTGGLIGICCVPSFLGRSGDLAAMLDHIEYAVKLIGADHVAIGTDVAYNSTVEAGDARSQMPRRGPSPPAWEPFWPSGSAPAPVYPQCMAWTNWPMFTVGMVQRGLPDDSIRKILGANVMRVAREALKP